MKLIAYTYCVIRYTHDVVAGESLNVGVVVYAPQGRFLGCRTERRYRRLAQTFLGFDGEQYQLTMSRFENGIIRIQQNMHSDLFSEGEQVIDGEQIVDVRDIVLKVWPDLGLSYGIGVTYAGLGIDPSEELEDLFDRLVKSQYRYETNEKRNDEDIYQAVKRQIPLNQAMIVLPKIQPHVFRVGRIQYPFDHTVKNGKWHPIQPVSLDLSKKDSIREKAGRVLGKATALSGNKDLGKMLVVFGRPGNDDVLQEAYADAKELLRLKMPVDADYYEEDQAEQFAARITEILLHKTEDDSERHGDLHEIPSQSAYSQQDS